ncbi:MAG: DUF4156 domain-containing protein [Lysobacterales bacterium]
MNKLSLVMSVAVCAAALHACTWVKTTPEGQSVRVASAAEVGACERKGKVTVSVKSRVSGVERKPTKVANELAALARNEGALLGGDTVVAEGDVSEGRQVFGVYRCKG